jgi:hypothetical protein
MVGVLFMAIVALGAREAVVGAAAEQVGRQVQRVMRIVEDPTRPGHAQRAEMVEFATRLLGHACRGRVADAFAALRALEPADAR